MNFKNETKIKKNAQHSQNSNTQIGKNQVSYCFYGYFENQSLLHSWLKYNKVYM